MDHIFSVLNNTLFLDVPQCIVSPIEGSFGCFHVLSVTNKAAVNM